MSFFAGNTYLQILVKLAAFAAANPALFKKLWEAILTAYHSAMDLAAKARDAFADIETGEGTLQLIETSDEEQDAEERLAALVYPSGTQALRESGQFRKVLGWLMTSEVGKALLAKLLSSLGS
jgi:ABC-type nitrate/sulfonate/bicarbonate transport system substrate-binding protein